METLKKQLEEKTRTEAMLKAKFSAHEDRHAQLAEMQPTVQEFIKEGIELGNDRHDAEVAFGESLAKAENVDWRCRSRA